MLLGSVLHELISKSSLCLSLNFQNSILFTDLPPTLTLPFSPRIVKEPSIFSGKASIVTAIVPNDPFSQTIFKTIVSSTSISLFIVALLALILLIGPFSQ